LNPINAQPIVTDPVTVPQDVAQTPTPEKTTSVQPEVKAEVKTESKQELQPVSKTTANTEVKQDQKQEPQKSKELVPGFGIVMSMQMLTQAYTIQNQQIIEAINMEQENDYAREQEIYFKLILADDIGDTLVGASAYQWSSLLRDNPIQRFDFDN
jgi:hypothetical protein